MAPELKDYTAQTLPAYQAQTDRVNSAYDAKQASDVAALQSAYDASLLDANSTLAKIPAAYQAQANAAAATSAQNRAAFNEYAASSGLNSGAGGQAQLAMNNALQNNLTAIRTNQANAVSDAELALAKLKSQYQDSIAAAQKENDYEKAAALLSEYQAAAQSAVSVAAEQANEYYRAYQSQLANRQYGAEWDRTSDETDYERALAQAQTLAQYGDFSGYQALGYTDDKIAAMRAYWRSQQ
jgi:hypothetical protein